MKELCRDIDIKYTIKENLIHYYNGIYSKLKEELIKHNIENTFARDAQLLSGITISCVEQFGKEMGKNRQ